MVDRATKLRWRRKFRRSQRHIENISVQAEHGVEKHFFKRLNKLVDVRRFVIAWVLLVVLLGGGLVMQIRALSPYYQSVQPVDGGIYTEGILGPFTTANPLYATNAVDSSVSRLLFSGIMKYNNNQELIGDLAENIQTNDRSNEFTVTLREDIRWHDGKPLTADDIVFTYEMIQNPDTKSPLRANWQNITMEAIDERTVKFVLPHSLSSFPHLMTNGIVPEHILRDIPVSQLRNAEFNTANPVGSGPFKWDSIQVNGRSPEEREEQIGFSPYKDYHAGAPHIDRFIIKAIHNENNLRRQFQGQAIDAIAGLSTVPEEFNTNDLNEYDFPLNAQVMTFFKLSHDVLQDKAVRQALTQAANRIEIIGALDYPVIPVQSPLLRAHLGFDKSLKQLPYDLEAAKRTLDENGWQLNDEGVREKDGVQLAFQLYSRDSGEYSRVAHILKKQWSHIGADVEVVLLPDAQIQSTIALHNYDALLYGIMVGGDPDVYAYWHSSQADPRSSSRLNFSELKSETIDSALEGGRSRSDKELRVAKYKPFLEEWRDQAPAIGLYQPRFLYIVRGSIFGLDSKVLNSGSDRLSNVHNWQIKTARVTIE